MRVEIVKGQRSRLHGAICRMSGCGRPVRTGEAVLYHPLEARYGEDRFVVHAMCASLAIDRAPRGLVPADPAVRHAAIARAIRETGDPFPDLEGVA